jgi:hypothetical protein
MARKASKVLTELQQSAVDAVLTGTPMPAEVSNPTLTLRSETVKQEIARARAEISDATTLKRLDVVEGILDGIGVARMMSDGGNVIRGWVEISKILGLAVPEVKTINLNVSSQRLRTRFEALSDQELLEIMEGEAKEVSRGD